MDSAENLPELPVSRAGIREASGEAAQMIVRLFIQKMKETGLASSRYNKNVYATGTSQLQSVGREITRLSRAFDHSSVRNAHLYAYGYSFNVNRIPVDDLSASERHRFRAWPAAPLVFYGPISVDANRMMMSLRFKDSPAVQKYLARIARKIQEFGFPIELTQLDDGGYGLLLSGHPYYVSYSTTTPAALQNTLDRYRRPDIQEPRRYQHIGIFINFDNIDHQTGLCTLAEMALEMDSMVKVVGTLMSRYLSEDQIDGMYNEPTPVVEPTPAATAATTSAADEGDEL